MKEIRWFEYDGYKFGEGAMIRYGSATIRELQKWITERSRSIASHRDDIKCRHLVYAAKWYGDDGRITKVCFYNLGLDDEEFDQIADMKNVQVYAFHKM